MGFINQGKCPKPRQLPEELLLLYHPVNYIYTYTSTSPLPIVGGGWRGRGGGNTVKQTMFNQNIGNECDKIGKERNLKTPEKESKIYTL
jgi:hypothetical protein